MLISAKSPKERENRFKLDINTRHGRYCFPYTQFSNQKLLNMRTKIKKVLGSDVAAEVDSVCTTITAEIVQDLLAGYSPNDEESNA